jgi:3D (Asp-Asp-Asp) domain-containing protein
MRNPTNRFKRRRTAPDGRAAYRGLVRWAGVAILLLIGASGCVSGRLRAPESRGRVSLMEVTGYCNCGKCCSWEYAWIGLGQPVVSKGPNRGKPKQIGLTSSGLEARHGTIAADTTRLPYGTLIEVPGYGLGRVEDTGGAIQGNRLDLWFADHAQALQWGRQKKFVKIWLPSDLR